MLNWLIKRITKNYSEVALFYVSFNLNKYEQTGAKDSCEFKLHPELDDDYIKQTLCELIDYIRKNYDMEKLSK